MSAGSAGSFPVPQRERATLTNRETDVLRLLVQGFGINVSDVQDAVQTAVGGSAVTQVLKGEQR